MWAPGVSDVGVDVEARDEARRARRRARCTARRRSPAPERTGGRRRAAPTDASPPPSSLTEPPIVREPADRLRRRREVAGRRADDRRDVVANLDLRAEEARDRQGVRLDRSDARRERRTRRADEQPAGLQVPALQQIRRVERHVLLAERAARGGASCAWLDHRDVARAHVQPGLVVGAGLRRVCAREEVQPVGGDRRARRRGEACSREPTRRRPSPDRRGPCRKPPVAQLSAVAVPRLSGCQACVETGLPSGPRHDHTV